MANSLPFSTAEERFWTKVEKTPECWLWTAGVTSLGIGQFRVEGKMIQAQQEARPLGGVGPLAMCRVDGSASAERCHPISGGCGSW